MEPIGTQLSNHASIEMTKDVSKPVARDFNLPIHSKQHMVVWSLSLHLVSSESCKTLEQKFVFEISTLNSHGIKEHFLFN